MVTRFGRLDPFPPLYFPHFKIQDGAAAIMKKSKNRQISAAVQPIAVKFGVVTHFCPS